MTDKDKGAKKPDDVVKDLDVPEEEEDLKGGTAFKYSPPKLK